MKKLFKILSIVLCISMLCTGLAFGTSAAEKYEYKLNLDKPANTYDLFDVYSGKWTEICRADGTKDFSKLVPLEEMKTGSGAASGNPGTGAGTGGALTLYKDFLTRKYCIDNYKSGTTFALKFTAPVKGTYSTNIVIPEVTGDLRNTNMFYFIGTEATGHVENTVGGTTNGRHDFNDKKIVDGAYQMTFELEKGQELIVCILSWNTRSVYTLKEISVTLTNAEEEAPIITDPVETTSKKETTTAEDTAPASTETNKQAEKDNIDLFVIIAAAAAVVVVAAVVVTVVVAKKKKK